MWTQVEAVPTASVATRVPTGPPRPNHLHAMWLAALRRTPRAATVWRGLAGQLVRGRQTVPDTRAPPANGSGGAGVALTVGRYGLGFSCRSITRSESLRFPVTGRLCARWNSRTAVRVAES
jgi:hypothetical protein